MSRNDYVRCGFCNNLYKGVAAVKAHIRQAHGKEFDQNNYSVVPPSPSEGTHPTPQGQPDFAKMLNDALAPLRTTLEGITKPQVPAQPPVPSISPMPQPAAPPPAPPAINPLNIPITEETGQKLCHGLECFAKTAEIFQQATLQAAGGQSIAPPASQGAHDHDHGEGHSHDDEDGEHDRDSKQRVEQQIDSFINCPDGVCSKILRRKILYNWEDMFPGLSLRRADGSALIAPEPPEEPVRGVATNPGGKETKPDEGGSEAGESAPAAPPAEGEAPPPTEGGEAGEAPPAAGEAGEAAPEYDDDDPIFGI
jgi:hypothetical protein